MSATQQQANSFDMRIPFVQMCIVILWPSFMIAVVATGIFFSAFHPEQLLPFDLDFEVNRLAAYTLGFFVFWFLSALSSAITMYFAITNCRKIHADQTRPPAPLNHSD